MSREKGTVRAMVEIIRLRPGESGEITRKSPISKSIRIGDLNFSSRREAADYLEITTTKLYEFIKKGELPDGRKIRS